MKIAFIGGGGNMGTALISGLIKSGLCSSNLYIIDVSEVARKRIENKFDVRTSALIDRTLADYDAIILAVKPQDIKDVAQTLSIYLTSQLVISIAAGIPCADIIYWLDGYTRIVRAIPNLPVLIGLGVTGLVAFFVVDESGHRLASDVFSSVGKTIWFDDESKLNAVTAISGSGPAYVFYFIETLQKAARQLGLSDEQCHTLVVETFVGGAQLALQSTEPLSMLRKNVTSSGGTTAAALDKFSIQGVSEAIVKGIIAANTRSSDIRYESG
ncbi:MAG: pyrroline-5-carboxylate reductase [Burkholderia sp.]|nr:pyrroline-5-carboxylate reductase [Burkholderia sp.]